MEVSALKYSGAGGLQGRSPLLRLQSDERLVNLIRRGNGAAFELLVSRYEARLLAFCRHMLGSREDAEDVLQEVMASAYNAIIADSRQINVRPWLYRIARNRSLNHLRRQQAIGVDSMDIHLSEHGTSTADKVHAREEFRMLVGDIHELPETQKTALVLRELDALSYEQIAEAMETTVPSVKSLLVRARVSLAEASEARLLTCDEVRIELAEVAEGLRKKPTSPVRRHVKGCTRCNSFESQVKRNNKALAALLPLGPLALLRKLLIAPLSHSAGGGAAGAAGSAGVAGATGSAGASAAAGAGAAGAGAAGAAGASAAGAGATAAGAAAAGGSGGLITAGVGALATKAAAGLAAAALVTAGAVEATHARHTNQTPTPTNTSHVADAVAAGVSQAKALGAGSTAAGAGTIAPLANTGATATATGTSATPTNTTAAATTNTATGTTTAPAGTDTSTTATGTTTTATTPTGTSTSATTTEPTATAPAPPASTKTDAASGGTVTSSTGTQTSATGTTTARTSTSTSLTLSLR